MIERNQAFAILAEAITDEIVVTGVGSQTASWLAARPRPLNLYLRGPMGLAPAVGLGVALAYPDREVVVIEGDGGLLMGLTSLASVAHRQPPNLLLICMDNGVYEAGGMGATVNAGRTDFVKIVQGLGIGQAVSAGDGETLRETVRELLAVDACAFLHVPIGLSTGKPMPAMFQPAEIKYRFQAALKAKSP
jgi:thiamine pyrophosphate-dependent acetolactate synthase large subunit-like protein